MNYGRFSVWLNGQGLQDIDDTVFVLDVTESTPDEDKQTATTAAPGSLLLARTRRALSVTITFCVREYDVTRRRQIVDEIRTLCAAGGWLEINERPNQRLWVVCDTLPTISSSQRWTENLSVVFVAYAAPYWQQKTATKARITVATTYGIVNIHPIGNAKETPLQSEITPAAETANIVKVVLDDDRQIIFDALGLEVGKTLNIGHDGYGRIFATIDGKSVLSKRTADSADDLIVPSGENTKILLQCDKACTATFSAYGRWI